MTTEIAPTTIELAVLRKRLQDLAIQLDKLAKNDYQRSLNDTIESIKNWHAGRAAAYQLSAQSLFNILGVEQ